MCGLRRELPVGKISQYNSLANFSFLGDIELVNCLADTLAKKFKDVPVDYFVCPHVKVTPLVHGVALRLGHKRFVVLRKSVKPYMESPVILRPLPEMPKHVQPLVINGKDVQLIHGQKVVIIDDVISTGNTMRMVNKLMEMASATVVANVAVLRQGDRLPTIAHLDCLYQVPIFDAQPRVS